MQMIVIVQGSWDEQGNFHSNEEQINEMLEHGWRVVSASPMGAYGFGYGYAGGGADCCAPYSDNGLASLLVLQRPARTEKRSTVRKPE
jgi:hypothetical protein